jgi:hypothetical protein
MLVCISSAYFYRATSVLLCSRLSASREQVREGALVVLKQGDAYNITLAPQSTVCVDGKKMRARQVEARLWTDLIS